MASSDKKTFPLPGVSQSSSRMMIISEPQSQTPSPGGAKPHSYKVFILPPSQLNSLGLVARNENGKVILTQRSVDNTITQLVSSNSNAAVSSSFINSPGEVQTQSDVSSGIVRTTTKNNSNGENVKNVGGVFQVHRQLKKITVPLTKPVESPTGTSSRPIFARRTSSRRLLPQFTKHWKNSLEEVGYIRCPLRGCNYICLSFGEMTIHYYQCKGEPFISKYICAPCNGRLKSADDLKAHLIQTHSGEGKIPRKQIKKVEVPKKTEEKAQVWIRKRAYSKVHKISWNIALGEKGYVNCFFKNCCFMALNLEQMIQHYGICNGTTAASSVDCPYCEACAECLEKLEAHVRKSHGENILQIVDSSIDNSLPEQNVVSTPSCSASSEIPCMIKEKCAPRPSRKQTNSATVKSSTVNKTVQTVLSMADSIPETLNNDQQPEFTSATNETPASNTSNTVDSEVHCLFSMYEDFEDQRGLERDLPVEAQSSNIEIKVESGCENTNTVLCKTYSKDNQRLVKDNSYNERISSPLSALPCSFSDSISLCNDISDIQDMRSSIFEGVNNVMLIEAKPEEPVVQKLHEYMSHCEQTSAPNTENFSSHGPTSISSEGRNSTQTCKNIQNSSESRVSTRKSNEVNSEEHTAQYEIFQDTEPVYPQEYPLNVSTNKNLDGEDINLHQRENDLEGKQVTEEECLFSDPCTSSSLVSYTEDVEEYIIPEIMEIPQYVVSSQEKDSTQVKAHCQKSSTKQNVSSSQVPTKVNRNLSSCNNVQITKEVKKVKGSNEKRNEESLIKNSLDPTPFVKPLLFAEPQSEVSIDTHLSPQDDSSNFVGKALDGLQPPHPLFADSDDTQCLDVSMPSLVNEQKSDGRSTVSNSQVIYVEHSSNFKKLKPEIYQNKEISNSSLITGVNKISLQNEKIDNINLNSNDCMIIEMHVEDNESILPDIIDASTLTSTENVLTCNNVNIEISNQNCVKKDSSELQENYSNNQTHSFPMSRTFVETTGNSSEVGAVQFDRSNFDGIIINVPYISEPYERTVVEYKKEMNENDSKMESVVTTISSTDHSLQSKVFEKSGNLLVDKFLPISQDEVGMNVGISNIIEKSEKMKHSGNVTHHPEKSEATNIETSKLDSEVDGTRFTAPLSPGSTSAVSEPDTVKSELVVGNLSQCDTNQPMLLLPPVVDHVGKRIICFVSDSNVEKYSEKINTENSEMTSNNERVQEDKDSECLVVPSRVCVPSNIENDMNNERNFSNRMLNEDKSSNNENIETRSELGKRIIETQPTSDFLSISQGEVEIIKPKSLDMEIPNVESSLKRNISEETVFIEEVSESAKEICKNQFSVEKVGQIESHIENEGPKDSETPNLEEVKCLPSLDSNCVQTNSVGPIELKENKKTENVLYENQISHMTDNLPKVDGFADLKSSKESYLKTSEESMKELTSSPHNAEIQNPKEGILARDNKKPDKIKYNKDNDCIHQTLCVQQITDSKADASVCWAGHTPASEERIDFVESSNLLNERNSLEENAATYVAEPSSDLQGNENEFTSLKTLQKDISITVSREIRKDEVNLLCVKSCDLNDSAENERNVITSQTISVSESSSHENRTVVEHQKQVSAALHEIPCSGNEMVEVSEEINFNTEEVSEVEMHSTKSLSDVNSGEENELQLECHDNQHFLQASEDTNLLHVEDTDSDLRKDNYSLVCAVQESEIVSADFQDIKECAAINSSFVTTVNSDPEILNTDRKTSRQKCSSGEVSQRVNYKKNKSILENVPCVIDNSDSVKQQMSEEQNMSVSSCQGEKNFKEISECNFLKDISPEPSNKSRDMQHLDDVEYSSAKVVCDTFSHKSFGEMHKLTMECDAKDIKRVEESSKSISVNDYKGSRGNSERIDVERSCGTNPKNSQVSISTAYKHTIQSNNETDVKEVIDERPCDVANKSKKIKNTKVDADMGNSESRKIPETQLTSFELRVKEKDSKKNEKILQVNDCSVIMETDIKNCIEIFGNAKCDAGKENLKSKRICESQFTSFGKCNEKEKKPEEIVLKSDIPIEMKSDIKNVMNCGESTPSDISGHVNEISVQSCADSVSVEQNDFALVTVSDKMSTKDRKSSKNAENSFDTVKLTDSESQKSIENSVTPITFQNEKNYLKVILSLEGNEITQEGSSCSEGTTHLAVTADAFVESKSYTPASEISENCRKHALCEEEKYRKTEYSMPELNSKISCEIKGVFATTDALSSEHSGMSDLKFSDASLPEENIAEPSSDILKDPIECSSVKDDGVILDIKDNSLNYNKSLNCLSRNELLSSESKSVINAVPILDDDISYKCDAEQKLPNTENSEMFPEDPSFKSHTAASQVLSASSFMLKHGVAQESEKSDVYLDIDTCGTKTSNICSSYQSVSESQLDSSTLCNNQDANNVNSTLVNQELHDTLSDPAIQIDETDNSNDDSIYQSMRQLRPEHLKEHLKYSDSTCTIQPEAKQFSSDSACGSTVEEKQIHNICKNDEAMKMESFSNDILSDAESSVKKVTKEHLNFTSEKVKIAGMVTEQKRSETALLPAEEVTENCIPKEEKSCSLRMEHSKCNSISMPETINDSILSQDIQEVTISEPSTLSCNVNIVADTKTISEFELSSKSNFMEISKSIEQNVKALEDFEKETDISVSVSESSKMSISEEKIRLRGKLHYASEEETSVNTDCKCANSFTLETLPSENQESLVLKDKDAGAAQVSNIRKPLTLENLTLALAGEMENSTEQETACEMIKMNVYDNGKELSPQEAFAKTFENCNLDCLREVSASDKKIYSTLDLQQILEGSDDSKPKLEDDDTAGTIISKDSHSVLCETEISADNQESHYEEMDLVEEEFVNTDSLRNENNEIEDTDPTVAVNDKYSDENNSKEVCSKVIVNDKLRLGDTNSTIMNPKSLGEDKNSESIGSPKDVMSLCNFRGEIICESMDSPNVMSSIISKENNYCGDMVSPQVFERSGSLIDETDCEDVSSSKVVEGSCGLEVKTDSEDISKDKIIIKIKTEDKDLSLTNAKLVQSLVSEEENENSKNRVKVAKTKLGESPTMIPSFEINVSERERSCSIPSNYDNTRNYNEEKNIVVGTILCSAEKGEVPSSVNCKQRLSNNYKETCQPVKEVLSSELNDRLSSVCVSSPRKRRHSEEWMTPIKIEGERMNCYSPLKRRRSSFGCESTSDCEIVVRFQHSKTSEVGDRDILQAVENASVVENNASTIENCSSSKIIENPYELSVTEKARSLENAQEIDVSGSLNENYNMKCKDFAKTNQVSSDNKRKLEDTNHLHQLPEDYSDTQVTFKLETIEDTEVKAVNTAVQISSEPRPKRQRRSVEKGAPEIEIKPPRRKQSLRSRVNLLNEDSGSNSSVGSELDNSDSKKSARRGRKRKKLDKSVCLEENISHEHPHEGNSEKINKDESRQLQHVNTERQNNILPYDYEQSVMSEDSVSLKTDSLNEIDTSSNYNLDFLDDSVSSTIESVVSDESKDGQEDTHFEKDFESVSVEEETNGRGRGRGKNRRRGRGRGRVGRGRVQGKGRGKKELTDNSDQEKPNLVEYGPECDPNEELQCGKCGEKMERKDYNHHNIMIHNGLGWLEGEPPFDMSDEKNILSILWKTVKNYRKQLKCETCGVVKKSAVGFLSHIEFCQVTAEEREAMKVKCEVCGRFMIPASLKVHLQIHRNDNKDQINIIDTVRVKRAAAQKATSLMQEVIKEETEADENQQKSADDTADLYRKMGPLRASNLTVAKWRRTIAVEGEAKCSFPGCRFKSSQLETLCQHFCTCDKSPKREFRCELCDHSCKTEKEMKNHVEHEHIKAQAETDPEDEEEEEVESTKKCSSKSYGWKMYNKFLFMGRETYGSANGDRPYIPALKWTIKFIKENHSKDDLFPEYHTSKADWFAVDEYACEEYLPQTKESISFSTIAMRGEVVDTDKVQFQWKKMKIFDSEIIDDVPTVFTGGPIWALAWCTIPFNETKGEVTDQFLAISCHQHMSDTFKSNERYVGKGLIQLWNFGTLNNVLRSTTCPKFVLGIAHDYGVVWDLEWCPSGCYDEITTDKHLQRIGLLAAACSDGYVHIFSVCLPASLESSGRYPVFKCKPVITLQVSSNISCELGGLPWSCLRLSWYKGKGHRIIAGGFNNGVVALWNLKTESSLLKMKKDNIGILLPYKSFQAHLSCVTALSLAPQDEGRFLMSGSTDTTIKVWDMEDSSGPIPPVVRKGMVTDGEWLTHWLSSVTSFDDVFSMGHCNTTLNPPRGYGFKVFPLLPQNSVSWSLSTTDWVNGVAQSTHAGELTAIFPHQMILNVDTEKGMKDKRIILSYVELKDILNSNNEHKCNDSCPVPCQKHQLEDIKAEIEKNKTNKKIKNEKIVFQTGEKEESDLTGLSFTIERNPRQGKQCIIKLLEDTSDSASTSKFLVDNDSVEGDDGENLECISMLNECEKKLFITFKKDLERLNVSSKLKVTFPYHNNEKKKSNSNDTVKEYLMVVGTVKDDKALRESGIQENKSAMDGSESKFSLPSDDYASVESEYGLVFCDFPADDMKSIPSASRSWLRKSEGMRTAPIEIYPITSLNKVKWNPNCHSFLWIAAGYQCGLLRVPSVSGMHSRDVQYLIKNPSAPQLTNKACRFRR